MGTDPVELNGDIVKVAEGEFIVRSRETQELYRVREVDRAQAVWEEEASAELPGWRVVLRPSSSAEQVSPADIAWQALFQLPAEHTIRESMAQTWCANCTTVGVTRGMCC